jgi:hypothetical protein
MLYLDGLDLVTSCARYTGSLSGFDLDDGFILGRFFPDLCRLSEGCDDDDGNGSDGGSDEEGEETVWLNGCFSIIPNIVDINLPIDSSV